MYSVTIIIQTASATYTRTLTFDTQDKADKAQAALSLQVDKFGSQNEKPGKGAKDEKHVS